MKQLVITIIRILFYILLSLIISVLSNDDNFFALFIFHASIITLSTEGSRFLVNKIRILFPRDKHKYLHIVIQLPVVTAFTFLILFIYTSIFEKFTHIEGETTLTQCFFISGIFAFFITTIYEGIDFFKHWKAYIIRSEQIEKANLVAKYETLKKQVHPHFLFNGLNILIGLIENKDQKASQYAQNLADFLKQLLSLQNQEMISLDEELQMVRQYSYIQQVRFNNTLIISINVDKKLLTKRLPPLAMQMLVENAIKHNITSQNKPLKVTIVNIENDYLQVSNNLQLKKNTQSAKVGLKNIEERYKYITDKRVEIIQNSDTFTVRIPLV